MARRTFLDAVERIGTAFLGGVIGNLGMVEVINVLGGNVALSFWQNLLAGGIMAVLSTIKAMIGAKKANTVTPVSIL